MRLRFWGTRGSIAKPGPTTLRYGGNTSCVEVRTDDGTLIVLDCGTGAHGLGRTLVAAGDDANRGHLLISHTHWDHIQGFPFFAPLRLSSSEWDVYGPRGVGPSLRETLAGQMNYTYFPVELSGLDARVRYHELVEGVFELGGVRVKTRYLNHPAVTLGYRLEADGVAVVYATDHEPHSQHLALGQCDPGPVGEDDAHASFLEGADLVIHDTQYMAAEYPKHIGYGHSTVEYVVDRTLDKGIRRLALFHHDPMRDDAGVDGIVSIARDRIARASQRMQVLGASEDLTLELKPQPKRVSARTPAPSARRAPHRSAIEQHVVLVTRDPQTLQTFRDSARADQLKLLEAADLDATIAFVKEFSPSLLVFERKMFEPGIAETTRRIRNAMGEDAQSMTVVGLVDSPGPSDLSAKSRDGVDEWVATPLTQEYARTRLRAWLLRTGCRWRRAPLPVDESKRIRALHKLAILDTSPEERFDRYTRIAAALFNVPMALVSLIDTDRQWFKSKYGLTIDETPRDQAFCSHTILDPNVMQVSDARVHPDFADSPLVTNPPYIRFYAGTPLTTHTGCRVGTLCIVDYLPRELDAKQLALLRDLGKLLEDEFEIPGS